MTKIEKKLITFVEKNIILIAALLVMGLAFLVRRQSIWYHSQDYIHYFDSHEGNIQSAAYYLVVRLLSYGYDIPMHGVKWLAAVADFGVSAFCVLLCRQEMRMQGGAFTSYDKIKLLLLYAGCLFAPALYLRGSVWAQIDSVSFALLLGALCLYRGVTKQAANKQAVDEKIMPEQVVPEQIVTGQTVKGQTVEKPAVEKQEAAKQTVGKAAAIGAVLLAGAGVALYPCAIVAVAAYFCYEYYYKKCSGKHFVIALTAVTGCALVCNGICGGGVQSFFGWITYHPYTGEIYDNVADWLWNMLILGGYGLALFSGLAAFRKKLPYALAVAVQVVITVCYGSALGW